MANAKEEAAVSESQHPYKTMKEADAGEIPPPATHNSPVKRRSRRRCFFTTCCLVFVVFLLALGLIVLVHWLVLQPKSAHYTLVDASIKTLNLTHVGTEFEVDAGMALNFTFSNPNDRIGMDIKGISVHALYAGEELGSSSPPPFYLGRKNEMTFITEVLATKRVLSMTSGAALRAEIDGKNVTLQVVMHAKVRNNHAGLFKSLHPFKGVHLTCFVNRTNQTSQVWCS